MKKIIFIFSTILLFAVSCQTDDPEPEKKTIFDTTFVSDTIWTEKIVTVYDTVKITILPDGTLSNTSWVKYIIDPANNIKDSVNVENEKTINLKNDVTRKGYDFLYWSNNPDGNGFQYKGGTEFRVTTHITLYAIWQSRDGITSAELYDFLAGCANGSTVDVKIVDVAPDFAAIRKALNKFYRVKVNLDLSGATQMKSMVWSFWEYNMNTSITNLLTVKLPSNLTSLPSNAFNSCEQLQSIHIPDGVTSIGENALNNCKTLKEIIIPNNVTTIGKGAFAGCSSITEISIPPSVESMPLNFSGCTALTKVTHSLKECTSTYFGGCKSLTSIVIPEIRELSSDAFYYCENLSEIVLPINLEKIGFNSFSNCNSLVKIKIPDGVTTISDNCFISCENLEEVELPETVLYLGEGSWDNPGGPGYAFMYCPKLKKVNISKSVKTIHLRGCESLTSLDIPDGVTSLILEYCGVTSVTIPESVTYLNLEATSLTSLKLECTTPPTLASWGLRNIEYSGTIYVPSSSVNAYKTADGWKDYADQIVGY